MVCSRVSTCLNYLHYSRRLWRSEERKTFCPLFEILYILIWFCFVLMLEAKKEVWDSLVLIFQVVEVCVGGHSGNYFNPLLTWTLFLMSDIFFTNIFKIYLIWFWLAVSQCSISSQKGLLKFFNYQEMSMQTPDIRTSQHCHLNFPLPIINQIGDSYWNFITYRTLWGFRDS